MEIIESAGYKICVCIDVIPKYSHVFGGENRFSGGISPNTGKPLVQIALFDLSDPLLHVSWGRVGSIPLLYSWTCEIVTDVFSYKILSNEEVEILSYACDGVNSENRIEPYLNYPIFFPPMPISLERLSENEITLNHNVYSSNNDVSYLLENGYRLEDLKPYHQVGGLPLLVVPFDYDIRCPLCKCKMPLFSTIGNRVDKYYEFIGNDWVQMIFFICLDCRVISAINQVS